MSAVDPQSSPQASPRMALLRNRTGTPQSYDRRLPPAAPKRDQGHDRDQGLRDRDRKEDPERPLSEASRERPSERDLEQPVAEEIDPGRRRRIACPVEGLAQ